MARTLRSDVQASLPSPLLLSYHGSVLPKTKKAVVFFSVYATGIWLLHHLGMVPNLGVGASSLTTVLSMVVGLMVSYRSSSSSERWSEGRTIWSQIQASTRTLLRSLSFSLPEPSLRSQDPQSKALLETMSLIIGYSYALKHYLRDEQAENYADTRSLISDSFLETLNTPTDLSRTSTTPTEKERMISASTSTTAGKKNVPLAILREIQGKINQFHLPSTSGSQPLLETVVWANALGSIKDLSDALTHAERIRDTPIPLALGIHLQQILFLYVAAIAPQAVNTIGVWSIPMTALAAFVFFGVDQIGEQLSDPFGTDANDLPIDRFCLELKMEYEELVGTSSVGTSSVGEGSSNGADGWTAVKEEIETKKEQ